MENLILERKIISCKDFSRLKYISLAVDRTVVNDTAQNRQSHSFEVANTIELINSMISEKLGFDIDPLKVGRSIGLLHDIGHMAKGHVGEKTLNRFVQFYSEGTISYESNSNNFIKLQKNKLFEGLSNKVKRYVLASLAKHPEELYPELSYVKKYIQIETKKELKYLKKHMLITNLDSTIQCQIMDIADEISYTISDIVDSTNVLSKKELISIFKKELDFETYLILKKTIGNKSNFRKELDKIYFLFIDNYTINKNGEVIYINKNIENLKRKLAFISKKYLLKSKIILDIRDKEIEILEEVFSFYFKNNTELSSKFYNKKLKFAKNDKDIIKIKRDFLAGITDKGLSKELKRIRELSL